MKVLVVATNTYRLMAPAPLGASLVAARLRRDGHQVRLLDLMFSQSPAEEAARVAREFRPDLICYSLRNVDSQSYTQPHDPLPVLQSAVVAVRANWPVTTLLGGTAFTTFPVQYMELLQADYGIMGDDLEPIASFVASLARSRPDPEVAGLVYREGKSMVGNRYEIHGYAGVAFDGWDLLELRPYRRSLDAFWDAGVVTRTGCPFDCAFCDTPRTFGAEWVLRDPRQVAEDLLTLKRMHGVRSVYLADAGFNRPLGHAKAVLEAILELQPGVELTGVFEPGEVDEEFARLYRRAGGRTMMIFAGSLSDTVLSASRRPFQVGDVMEGAELLRRAGVDSCLYLTLGGPGETPATVEETLARAPELRPIYTMVDHGLRILPETLLQQIAVYQGVVPEGHTCFKPVFYHSPDTPPAVLGARLRRYRAEHRLDSLRGLSWMARMAWNKLRP
jgi:radical SAM superfamily enzyme YgiQ (UPF0313 family)